MDCEGILVTGLDLWQEKNGVRNDDTLGVARTRGMCHYKFSCTVGEQSLYFPILKTIWVLDVKTTHFQLSWEWWEP